MEILNQTDFLVLIILAGSLAGVLAGLLGVGGGIVALYPNKYCIAVWSPRLNERGNSYRGMQFLELFTDETQLSIF